MKKGLLLLFFFCSTQASFAAIHYTSVLQPLFDTPLSYDIDFDGDNDFTFYSSSTSGNVYVKIVRNGCWYAAEGSTPSGFVAKAYQKNSPMGTYHWASRESELMNLATSSGNWYGVDRYMMVKLATGTDTLYGWIRLQWFNYPAVSLGIVSFAYNDVPDSTIMPGEGEPIASGISEVNTALFNLTNINKNQISFSNTDSYDQVKVYSTDGKLVTEINKPTTNQVYALQQNTGLLLVSFFKKDQLLYTSKQLVQ